MQKLAKYYKGEKYIYLLMGYILAKQNGGRVNIGDDNGMVGGQNYQRSFSIQEYNGAILLNESKSAKSFNVYTRVFEIIGGEDKKPTIKDYIEGGDNYGQDWHD